MAQTKMTEEQAYFALASYADVDTVKFPTYQAYKREYSVLQQRTTKLENYARIYKKYVNEMGESEFALYNTLTHIATHGSAKSGDKAQAVSTFDTRQKEVAKVCQQYITSYRIAA